MAVGPAGNRPGAWLTDSAGTSATVIRAAHGAYSRSKRYFAAGPYPLTA
jgi:hypothetical protein